MSDNDFTFMKSGFNTLIEKDETIENITSIIMVFMENAIKTADIYVKHCNRNCITSEDIKRSLMLEVFFMKQRPNMLEKCEDMKKTIKEIIEMDSDDEEDDDEEIINETDDDPFCESKCNCAICKCTNTIYDRWSKFTPSTSIELAMAKNIINIE